MKASEDVFNAGGQPPPFERPPSPFRTLSFKLTSGICAALLVIFSVFFYQQYQLHKSHLLGGLRDSLTRQGLLLAKGLEFAMLANHPAVTQEMVMELSRGKGVHRVWILDKRGDVKASSDGELVGQRVDMQDPMCLICHHHALEQRSRTVVLKEKDGTELFRSVIAIANQEKCFSCHNPSSRINGVLIIDHSLSEIGPQLRSDLWAMVKLALLMLAAIALVITLLAEGLILRKVRTLQRASRSVQRGDLDQRVQITGNDEISDLAEHFNRMTESVQASLRKIEQQKEYLEKLINSVDDCVLVVDRDYRIATANRSYAARFGGGIVNSMNGAGFRRTDGFLQPSDVLLYSTARRSFELAAVTKTVGCLPSREGKNEFWEVYASPVKDERGEVMQVVEVMRDITERKLLEQRLSHSERLASLGMMASGICHEINNPLASVTACLDGVQRRMRDKRSLEGQDLKEVTEYLELVQKEMARCKELTQRLLTLSEKPKARLDDLDLHRLLAETLSLLREQARAREITIETELSPELKRILADRDQIQQVFVNLILNAMEAVGSAGKVRIVSRVEGDKAIIQVIDTGKGIKEEDLERVFEPFFSKALGKKGIGLGLTICESIIRQHKGDIQIRSQYGQGTTVTMVLPLNPDAVDLAASPASGVTDETGNLHPDRG